MRKRSLVYVVLLLCRKSSSLDLTARIGGVSFYRWMNAASSVRIDKTIHDDHHTSVHLSCEVEFILAYAKAQANAEKK